MNRKRRNKLRANAALKIDNGWAYWSCKYAPANKQIPLKDWVKRLARVHRHDRTAAVQMFEARFGELVDSPMFKRFRYAALMLRYRRTGFMFPIFIYQDLPVLQSITGDNQGE